MMAPQPFLVQLITDVQHKLKPRSYPTHFYILHDLISPQILLSCITSDQLGIMEFRVPSEAYSILLNAVTTLNSQITKHISFCKPLETTLPEIPTKLHRSYKPKPILKTLTPSNTETIPDQVVMANLPLWQPMTLCP